MINPIGVDQYVGTGTQRFYTTELELSERHFVNAQGKTIIFEGSTPQAGHLGAFPDGSSYESFYDYKKSGLLTFHKEK